MKTNNSLKENHPEAKKKLRLPDQLELVMEDGTVYRVHRLCVSVPRLPFHRAISLVISKRKPSFFIRG